MFWLWPRRDAERWEGSSVAALADLAASGLHVARLIIGSAWIVERAALEARGVSTEVLPTAS